ncbi:MAG: N-acetylmuramoyl-L-alanine amidase [Campylobacterales bacterium]|nr:N-acetylmuramoyl-L-alanine amidase [Campylobacterales bacterium]
MLSRWLFISILFSYTLVYAVNVLEKVLLNDKVLELQFRSALDNDQIHSFDMKNPTKKVFDFNNVIMGQNIGTIDASNMVRIAQNQPTKIRVVIDGEIGGEPYFSPTKKTYKIPLELKKNELAFLFADKSKNENNLEPQNENNKKNIDKQETKKEKEVTTTSLCSANGDVVVIDAGHGGKDPGATSGGKKEKDAVLAMAKKLDKVLTKRGYKVYLTRDDDRFLTLEQRTKIADHKDAKIFVSLHCNAAPNEQKASSMYGVETFFLQKTRDARSKRVAERENSAVLQGTDRSSKQVILDAVLSGPKIILSHKLAIDIQRNLLSNLRAHDGGVRSAPFWVLVGASRPSVLVEIGYITHPEERRKLFDPNYQEQAAKGIADGIGMYLANRAKEIDN